MINVFNLLNSLIVITIRRPRIEIKFEKFIFHLNTIVWDCILYINDPTDVLPLKLHVKLVRIQMNQFIVCWIYLLRLFTCHLTNGILVINKIIVNFMT